MSIQLKLGKLAAYKDQPKSDIVMGPTLKYLPSTWVLHEQFSLQKNLWLCGEYMSEVH